MKDYASNLSQSERLALAGSPCFIPLDSIGVDEREAVTISRPRFPMPSIASVREHDARLSAYGSDVNVSDEETDENEDEDGELRQHALDKRMDGMREHSFRLPSQRSRRDVSDTLASMGLGYND